MSRNVNIVWRQRFAKGVATHRLRTIALVLNAGSLNAIFPYPIEAAGFTH